MIPTRVREEERKVFTDTLAKIVEAIAPEKIICFGSRTDYHEAWSNFTASPEPQCVTHYDLLIITKEGERRKEHEILDKIEKSCSEPIHVTAVVHSITAVNTALKEGSRFFTRLCDFGTIVYEGNNIPLVRPMENFKVSAQTHQKEWERSFGLGERFFKSAAHCASIEINDISAFMLHQAVEHICNAIITLYMGYQPATHNLKKLLMLMENFACEIHSPFPQINKEEDQLFSMLFRAYNDVRYSKEYKVSSDTIVILLDRVNQLRLIVENLHKAKMQEFVKAEEI